MRVLVLVLYDLNKEIKVVVDVFFYGLGGVVF